MKRLIRLFLFPLCLPSGKRRRRSRRRVRLRARRRRRRQTVCLLSGPPARRTREEEELQQSPRNPPRGVKRSERNIKFRWREYVERNVRFKVVWFLVASTVSFLFFFSDDSGMILLKVTIVLPPPLCHVFFRTSLRRSRISTGTRMKRTRSWWWSCWGWEPHPNSAYTPGFPTALYSLGGRPSNTRLPPKLRRPRPISLTYTFSAGNPYLQI